MGGFFFFSAMIIPGVMLLFGWAFYKSAPDEINQWCGYRTRMSMKNERTWRFAQHYFSKIWLIGGGPMAGVSAAVFIPFWVGGTGVSMLSNVMLILMGVQVAVLFLSIIPTERALRRNFDKDGNPR